ncbi:outer membrane protein transport protein [Reichenbachiella agarivorans]|uniref:Outer membrane protein transport protein n=1 Tax=Reichenbachiella agarivorans TaxID=2979464 RepID=A0ABY6CSH7_9BACT|nr:outer membrane protein transport protein [Reichenbachiella agarivorans]UXP33451.1 outer membrane protein transport protein [Reichenbachiella agarivorans]
MKKTNLSLLFLLVFASSAYTQDAHYWTEQFGNKSMLLGGNVIGSVDDLGATFYNPARLALQDNPTFLISAKAYQLSSLKVKDGVEKTDLNESNFGNAPTLAAGSFRIPILPKHKFAYAFLSRQQVDYNLGTRSELTYEFNDTWAGQETLYIDFGVSKTIRDEWMGGSWAYLLNDHFSVGVSGFLSTLDQKRTYALYEDGLSADDGAVASFERTRVKKFQIYSLVFKVGMNYEAKNLSIGMTITTPYAVLRKSAKTEYDEVLTGFDLDSDGDIDDDSRLIKNSTSNVEVQYKTPFSIGVGAAYDFGAFKLHGSAEWFAKVDRYAILVPEPFTAQKAPVNDMVFMDRMFDERQSVINWGVGMEFNLVKKLQGFLSVAVDHSTLDDAADNTAGLITDNFTNSIFTTDIYHYGGGFLVKFDKIEFTIGSVYSRGNQTVGKIVNLPDDNTNPDQRVEVVWERWRFLVGFTLPFYKFGKKG